METIGIKDINDFNTLIEKNILDIPNLSSKDKNRNFLLITQDGVLFTVLIKTDTIDDIKYIGTLDIPINDQIFYDYRQIVNTSKTRLNNNHFIITKMSFYDTLMDLNRVYDEDRILITVDKNYNFHYTIDVFANQNDFGYKASDTIFVKNPNRYK